MAVSTFRYRCLYASTSSSLSYAPRPRNPRLSRSLATAVSETSATNPASHPQRPTSFRDKLNSGPSFSDFVVGGRGPKRRSGALGEIIEPEDEGAPLSHEDALELNGGHEGQTKGIRRALVGPPGKQKEIIRLPEWLKTPIPTSDNFKKIKNDLRGLDLHTGSSMSQRKGFGDLLTLPPPRSL